MHKKDRVVKVGDKVDVRDTEHIWCVGQVELKISTANRVPLLYIHYEVRDFYSLLKLGLEQKIR
jgi:hypothetical protein